MATPIETVTQFCDQVAEGDAEKAAAFFSDDAVYHFTQGDRDIALPVMGTFEVRDGKISAWRDYFDMAQFTNQMSAE